MTTPYRFPILTVVLLATNSCALLGKSAALTPRYFNPDASPTASPLGPRPPDQLSTNDAEQAMELNLGRVTRASYLDQRIAFRSSEYEVGFYEGRRWTEGPEVYLRRGLSRSLFGANRLRRIVSGPGPTLEVELTEFAELRFGVPAVRAAATYVLYDNRVARRESTVTIELPIAKHEGAEASPEATVVALANALRKVVAEIAEQVIAELTRAAVIESRVVD